jgi:DNA-binding PadR family transcriptional regulator
MIVIDCKLASFVEYPVTRYFMRPMNKTRYAILGALLEGPSTGYEIKALMGRSTVYFWRESDSTIYPMLKILAKEGKVLSEVAYVGKKKKEIFSITPSGREEFRAWLKGPTSEETPRNEFLLKFFFVIDRKDLVRLFQEKLEKAEKTYEEYKKIESRLESLGDSPQKAIRLKALRYGMIQLASEITWLKEGI